MKNNKQLFALKNCFAKTWQYCVLSCLALSGMVTSATAQYNSMWHTYIRDAKNYATAMVPGTTNRESVMAGTYYGSNGLGTPHFAKIGNGSALYLHPEITAENIYIDNDFIDQRVVDVVARQNDEYFIVVSAREDNSLPTPKDKVKIILADNNAANNGDRIYYDPDNDNNLYPMSALYDANNDLLFVCGFVTTLPTFYPDYPDELSPKQAFVMSINVSNTADPTSWNVMAINYFESSPTYGFGVGETQNTTELDWDMAMRMQIIKDGPWADNIFVTGSVNAVTESQKPTSNCGSPTFQTKTYVRSATMVHVLDPISLDEVNSASRHFVDEQPTATPDGYGMMEYGVALVQGDDGTGEDNYIVSNIYDAMPDGCGNAPNDWFNTQGFNAKVKTFAITHANEDFITDYYGLSTDRMIFDARNLNTNAQGMYAVQVMESDETRYADNHNTDPDRRGDVRFVIAGMAYVTPDLPNTCSLMLPLINPMTTTNIIPFVYDVDIQFNQNTGFGSPDNVVGSIFKTDIFQAGTGCIYGSYLKFYDNQIGTGDPTLVSNSYANLGDGLSHIFYAPAFADRNMNETDLGQRSIVMNIPKWQDSYADGTIATTLGFKTQFVHSNTCQSYALDGGCAIHCDLDDDPDKIENVTDQKMPANIMEDVPNTLTRTVAATLSGDCSGYLTSSPVYKPSDVENLVGENGNEVYPNPAQDVLHIGLSSSIAAEADITVQLLNMQGQVVGNLYTGKAGGIRKNQAVNLPDVASGLYIIQILNGADVLLNQKLSIQK